MSIIMALRHYYMVYIVKLPTVFTMRFEVLGCSDYQDCGLLGCDII